MTLKVTTLSDSHQFFAVRKDEHNVYHAFINTESSLCGVKLDSVQPILGTTDCSACIAKVNQQRLTHGLMPKPPFDLTKSYIKVLEGTDKHPVLGYNFDDDTYKINRPLGCTDFVPANTVSVFDGDGELIAKNGIITLDTSLCHVTYKQGQPVRLVAVDWEFSLVTHKLDNGDDKVSGIHLIQFPYFEETKCG